MTDENGDAGASAQEILEEAQRFVKMIQGPVNAYVNSKPDADQFLVSLVLHASFKALWERFNVAGREIVKPEIESLELLAKVARQLILPAPDATGATQPKAEA